MNDKRPGSGGGRDELVFVGLGGLEILLALEQRIGKKKIRRGRLRVIRKRRDEAAIPSVPRSIRSAPEP